jgi:signal transduction histidine kinase
MTWQTRNAADSERDRIAAESRADLQEKMRLALWRMDSLGATLVVDELESGLVRSRVEWKENGELTLPGGNSAPLDLQQAIIDENAPFDQVYRTLDHGVDRWKSVTVPPPEDARIEPRISQKGQQMASNLELQKRSEAVTNATSKLRQMPVESAVAERSEEIASDAAADPLAPAAEAKAVPVIPTAPPKPIWIGENLFLLTPARGAQRTISGVWINLGALENRLLGEILDLLPAAMLVPAKAASDDGLVLASFPLRLVPGPSMAFQSSLSASITLSLIAGWSAALIAILAASLLLFGVMRLSERRASFVSAVTHELRTPLTTFRLYSDMLESDVVKPEKRGDYLRVLSREADRLAHLVENVLAFSGIERGSARSTVTTSSIEDLLVPMRERFEGRLASAEMTLGMNFENAGEKVQVDATAIEHILFNLIDNAAKYAAGGSLKVVEISVNKAPRFLEIHVADHGPGIPLSEHRRIFRAFHKSAREAAESKPGVGLGLSLSRRLARNLGGDLTCVRTAGASGAHFLLTLPISRPD